MHLISARRVKEAAARYPDVDRAIKAFCKKVEQAEWQNLIELQQDYQSAEAVGNFTVINIRGNKYRIILSIEYEEQIAYFKYFLTHADYDRDEWKNDLYFR
ncbi:type II toxin-antitoxin system HigB family toxin [Chamaesiphon polymorphus]|uniref:Type II toxin-antitoxin system HigB family toxin n=1 Tax=Chamaesiphon polymorphus CCALA 037 TaxID=2107692 RepID=A0A2T1GM54_9CYAN|nr:type II toxin-antitoxin system HigB family toxin [Chamaesiphon polymorphus]PSB58939.1 type II toxin-antitoxin system HigB family toxin [Chamaesiphon polymorphus CCALA 037]